MTVTTIHSGSDGNSYLVKDDEGKTVILDCGVKFQNITHHKEFPKFCDVDFVFTTHCHLDHSKSLKDFKNSGCAVLTYETLEQKVQHHSIGNWEITTFPLAHNVENWGIILKHTITGEKLCYMTDFFKAPMVEGCDIYIYEINYIEAVIDEMIEQDKDIQHNGFRWHNSLENAIDYFSRMNHKPKIIYCCHGSKLHSIKQKIYEGMKQFADEVVVL